MQLQPIVVVFAEDLEVVADVVDAEEIVADVVAVEDAVVAAAVEAVVARKRRNGFQLPS